MRLYQLIFASLWAAALLSAGPLTFEPNRGQTDAQVRYFAHTQSAVVFFTDREMVVSGASSAVRFEFTGSNPRASWQTADTTTNTTSYFVGRDPSKYARDVPHYGHLTRSGVYPGIDVVYYGNENHLEYDFVVAPHADPSRIRIRVKGSRGLSIRNDGTLVIDTENGQLYERKPALYQQLSAGSRRTVEGSFRLLSRNEIGFTAAKYDRNTPLAIDPVLESSTYFGGSFDDKIVGIDSSGNVAGNTSSLDFPGASIARRQGSDVFVQFGSQTFIFGGSGDDVVTSVDIQSLGYYGTILVGGYTNSQDLPTSFLDPRTRQPVNGWQTNYAGGNSDGFVLSITTSPASSGAYMFASYVGTPGDDRVTAIANIFSNNFAIAGTTNGVGLPQPQSDLPPWPNAPAGGLDAFVLYGYSYQGAVQPTISSGTYFGGSGDDTPLAILVTDGTGFYIAGETTSPDFPVVNGPYTTLNGPSDAFLTKFTFTPAGLAITASTLFGGSQTDRGIHLATWPQGINTSIVLVGSTSSTDLPLVNPTQKAYGGGASDAFVAQFKSDLSQVLFSTYVGGSGADEATSATTDYIGNLFVGGWTSSTDFPVKNALQSAYGGGPDDGFFTHFQVDGSLYQSSYFGGSNSDRILALAAPNGPRVFLAGQTTSTDLPLQNATQTSLQGPSDGFIAKVSENTLQIGTAITGKDLRLPVSILAGNIGSDPSTQLTITSSDPSKVVLAPNNSNDPGQSSIQVPFVGVSYLYFQMDCLDDHGGSDLTFSAPGHTDTTVHATCLETHIQPYLSTTNLQPNSQPLPLGFQFVPGGVPGAIPYTYPAVRPGVSLTAQITNTNPTIATVAATTVSFTGSQVTSDQPLTFTPLAAGQTTIMLSAPFLKPGSAGDQLTVTIGPTVQFSSGSSLTIPAGFQTRLLIRSNGLPGQTSQVKITSGDPARLLLTTDPSQQGTASVVYSGSPGDQVYAQALASSGDIPVTISAPGNPDSTTIVHLTSPIAGIAASANVLNVGDTATVRVLVGGAGSNSALSLLTNPGQPPLQFSLTSSDATVIGIPVSTIQSPSPYVSSASFQVAAVGPGSATLSLHAPDGIAVGSGSSTIEVIQKTLQLGDTEVGKDLIGTMTLRFPQPLASATTVTVTTNNPTLALLSSDLVSPGQAQITVVANKGATSVSFNVYGLASSGQAKITATAGALGSVTANVQLDPSGFGWTQNQLTGVLYSIPGLLFVSTFALDPATLAPVAQQSLRPGVSASGTISNSNPDVATSSTSFVLNSQGTYSVGLTFIKVGKTTLQVNQPAGFTAPSARTQLPITVTTPALSLSIATVAKDSQITYSVQPAPSTSNAFTLSSSDPSKLVISTDPNQTGSGSVTIPAGTRLPNFYLQALDNSGTVTLTASEPTYTDATATITLTSITVLMSISQGGSSGAVNTSSNNYSTTTQSPNTRIALSLVQIDPVYSSFGQGITLRPGVSPPQVQVQSSNPAAGQIIGNPVTVTTTGVPGVDFKPVGIGQTDVSLIVPPGFAASSKVTFNVTAPGFISQNTLMAKDTAAAASIGLTSNVQAPAINVTVTVTSTDPSRVLLSRDANSPASASITTTLIAGQTYVNGVYMQALANNGIVPIKITAPGYADSTFNVALTDLVFQFGQPYSSQDPIQTTLQASPRQVTVSTSAIAPKGLPTSYVTYGYGGSIRPGVSVVATVLSSNPGIVSIDKPQLTFAPGSSSATFNIHAAAAGQTTLSLALPDGYVLHPTYGTVPVTVNRPNLTFYTYGAITVGRDLQVTASIGTNVAPVLPPSVTITSSDPSRLLVSADQNTPGQESITVAPSANGLPAIYIQALSDNGTVSIAATADGYQAVSTNFTLAPSAAVFGPTGPLNIYTNSGAQRMSVSLSALDPTTLRPASNESARAGANLQVSLTSSDSSIITVDQPVLQFTSATQNVTFQAFPRGVGTATLTLGLLPGGVAPASGQQMVLNVSEPDFFIPDFYLGVDLQVPVTVTLASTRPAPTSDLPINICSNYGGLNLSPDSSSVVVNQCVATIIPAGQRVSKQFYVQAWNSSATDQLRVSSPTGIYQPSSSNVYLTPRAFIFKEAVPGLTLNVPRGGSSTFTVVPSLVPLTTSSIAPLSIRAGAFPITLGVASSDPKIASVPSTVVFKPGDPQQAVVVQGVALGTVTVSLSTSGVYNTGTNRSSFTAQVK